MSGEPLTTEAFMKYIDDLKTSLSDELKTSLSQTIRTEVTAAVAPLLEKHAELVDDISSTKVRVTNVETESALTKARVAELEKQVDALKHPTPSFPQQNVPTQFPTLNTLSSAKQDLPLPSCPDAQSVLRDAKRIVGFSPITIDDIRFLKDQNPALDDAGAMSESIKEFLKDEMKVPTYVTDKFVIKRVFPPARPPPTGWNTLYAEFTDLVTTDTIFQFARNLRPGRNVSIYVPHSLHHRFTAVNSIAHEYRNGPVKHKTRVKYGYSDFVLLVKPKNSDAPWSYPPLDLPPLQLSHFDGNTGSSPPPGRTRLTSKRSRPVSGDSPVQDPSSKAPREDSEKAGNEALDTVTSLN